jgi:hypothetical protein
MLGTDTLWLAMRRAWSGSLRSFPSPAAFGAPCSDLSLTAPASWAPPPMPDQLRQRAAMAIRLAKQIPGDPMAETFLKLAAEYERQAAAVDAATLQQKEPYS